MSFSMHSLSLGGNDVMFEPLKKENPENNFANATSVSPCLEFVHKQFKQYSSFITMKTNHTFYRYLCKKAKESECYYVVTDQDMQVPEE